MGFGVFGIRSIFRFTWLLSYTLFKYFERISNSLANSLRATFNFIIDAEDNENQVIFEQDEEEQHYNPPHLRRPQQQR